MLGDATASWAKVEGILIAELGSRIQDASRLSSLFNNLIRTNDGKRLAISLAIDLAVKAFSAPTVESLVAILNSIDPSADARVEFGRLLEASPNRDALYCASQFFATDVGDGYLTVVSLKKFIDCAGAAFGYTDDPEDESLLKLRFASLGPMTATGFGYWWSHEHRIVWVTCARRFMDRWTQADPATRASVIKDAMGLPRPPYLLPGHLLDYFAFRYPPGFRRPLYQPTSLDAWWRDPAWYLSYRKENGWGRTRSISGQRESEWERVHRAFQFESISSEYGLWYLGTAAECPEDLDGAIDAGLDIINQLDPQALRQPNGK
jgi:hypothetical protein